MSENEDKKLDFKEVPNWQFIFSNFSSESYIYKKQKDETINTTTINIPGATDELLQDYCSRYVKDENIINDIKNRYRDLTKYDDEDKDIIESLRNIPEGNELSDDEISQIVNCEAKYFPETFVRNIKKILKNDGIETKEIILKTGNFRSTQTTQKAEKFKLDDGSIVGISQMINLGKDENGVVRKQTVIATHSSKKTTDLISIIKNNKVVASFQATDDQKMKLVFKDDEVKKNFVNFFEQNNIEPPLKMEDDGIVFDNVSLDNRLDLRVGGANSQIGILFSAFGLQIADKDKHSAIYRNAPDSPFNIAVSDKFINMALAGENGCSVDQKFNPALKTLLVGQIALATKNRSGKKRVDLTFGESKTNIDTETGEAEVSGETELAQSAKYKLTAIIPDVISTDKNGNLKSKKDGSFTLKKPQVELRFLEKDNKDMFLYCSPSIPDALDSTKTRNLGTDFYKVLDMEIYNPDSEKENYKIDNMPNNKECDYLRLMIQDPKDTTKAYAIVYPIPKTNEKTELSNAELSNFVKEFNEKPYTNAKDSPTQNLRNNQLSSNEKIALATTYAENEVAEFRKTKQNVVGEVSESGEMNVVVLNNQTVNKINDYYNVNIDTKSGIVIVGDTDETVREQDDSVAPVNPDGVNPDSPAGNNDEHNSNLEKPKEPTETAEGPFRKQSLWVGIGFALAILSVFMPFLLPLSYISLGVAITKPWEWPAKLQQRDYQRYQDSMAKHFERKMENENTREILNNLSESLDNEDAALEDRKQEVEQALAILNGETGEVLPTYEYDIIRDQLSKAENELKDINAEIEKQEETLKENMDSHLQKIKQKESLNKEIENAKMELDALDKTAPDYAEKKEALEKGISEMESLVKICDETIAICKELDVLYEKELADLKSQKVEKENKVAEKRIPILVSVFSEKVKNEQLGLGYADQVRGFLKEELQAIDERRENIDKLKQNISDSITIMEGNYTTMKKKDLKNIEKGTSDQITPEATLDVAQQTIDKIRVTPEFNRYAQDVLTRATKNGDINEIETEIGENRKQFLDNLSDDDKNLVENLYKGNKSTTVDLENMTEEQRAEYETINAAREQYNGLSEDKRREIDTYLTTYSSYDTLNRYVKSKFEPKSTDRTHE